MSEIHDEGPVIFLGLFAIQEEDASDCLEGGLLGINGGEEGLEDGGGERFEVFGDLGLGVGTWCGEVVHDKLYKFFYPKLAIVAFRVRE